MDVSLFMHPDLLVAMLPRKEQSGWRGKHLRSHKQLFVLRLIMHGMIRLISSKQSYSLFTIILKDKLHRELDVVVCIMLNGHATL